MIMIIGEQEDYVYIGADGIYSTSEVMVSSNTFWSLLVWQVEVIRRSSRLKTAIENQSRVGREVLLNLKDRRFRSLKLAVGDGALSVWKVERKVLVQTRSQHC